MCTNVSGKSNADRSSLLGLRFVLQLLFLTEIPSLNNERSPNNFTFNVVGHAHQLFSEHNTYCTSTAQQLHVYTMLLTDDIHLLKLTYYIAHRQQQTYSPQSITSQVYMQTTPFSFTRFSRKTGAKVLPEITHSLKIVIITARVFQPVTARSDMPIFTFFQ